MMVLKLWSAPAIMVKLRLGEALVRFKFWRLSYIGSADVSHMSGHCFAYQYIAFKQLLKTIICFEAWAAHWLSV